MLGSEEANMLQHRKGWLPRLFILMTSRHCVEGSECGRKQERVRLSDIDKVPLLPLPSRLV